MTIAVVPFFNTKMFIAPGFIIEATGLISVNCVTSCPLMCVTTVPTCIRPVAAASPT